MQLRLSYSSKLVCLPHEIEFYNYEKKNYQIPIIASCSRVFFQAATSTNCEARGDEVLICKELPNEEEQAS